MMPNMNENSAAATGATPNAKATATVDPLRETPGRIAKACATPMYAAAFQVGSLCLFETSAATDDVTLFLKI